LKKKNKIRKVCKSRFLVGLGYCV